mmetsp:Transcript_11659/g.10143  ORF Transcript_11659/g.10143 Transcript_11659/m.10143 type:complete len:83 (-) Transcript_11659:479-727(-)
MDEGCGITEDSLKTIFNRYAEVNCRDPDNQNDYSNLLGSKLGLYISRKLCEKMRGQIRAYSRAGIGSVFTFCVPTKSAENVS